MTSDSTPTTPLGILNSRSAGIRQRVKAAREATLFQLSLLPPLSSLTADTPHIRIVSPYLRETTPPDDWPVRSIELACEQLLHELHTAEEQLATFAPLIRPVQSQVQRDLKRLLAWLGVYIHAQNLNVVYVNRREQPAGSMLKHGRAWLYWLGLHATEESGLDSRPMLHVEWSFGRLALSLSINMPAYEGDDASLSVRIPLASLFVTGKHLLPRSIVGLFANPNDDHEFHLLDLAWFEGCLWWKLLVPERDEYPSGDPFWRSGHWCPADWLFGRTQYTSRHLAEEHVPIPLPEETYSAALSFEEATWTRPGGALPGALVRFLARLWPRWPLAQRARRIKVEIPGGLPVPGKGENSWDMGDDAIYSTTLAGTSAEEAIARVVGSVLKQRRSYGGSYFWQPKPVAPVSP